MDTAQGSYSLFRVIKITLVVSATIAAVLALPNGARAAAGNTQICNPSASCTIGEFLYDDSYNPITSGATCTITSRYPNGTLFLDNVSLTASSEGDGWYAYTFTAPTTLGLYRTTITCTVSGNTMRLDKSFEVKTEASSLSSNDIASAVWGYSGRTLTSFGSLITDIWNAATRTLTGAGLSSGTIATKADVDEVKSKVDNIKSETSEIKNLTTTNTTNITNIQNLDNSALRALEKLTNGVIIKHEIGTDEPFSFDIKTKIEKTQSVALELSIRASYLSGKTRLLEAKWKDLRADQISLALARLQDLVGQEKDDSSKNSIFGKSNWLYEKWGWKEVNSLLAQARSIKLSLASLSKNLDNKGKTNDAYRELKVLISSINRLESSIGNLKSSSGEKNIFGKISEVRNLSIALDSQYADINRLLSNWNAKTTMASISKLRSNVLAANRLPLDPKIFEKTKPENTEKSLKNQLLSMLGIIQANKQLLSQRESDAFATWWLELGSIVFKTIITNPSSTISQTVPLKYYLPQGVKKENITQTDEGLTVSFDPDKNQYFVSGTFVLAPNESRTLSVFVDDKVFEIPEHEVDSMRKQAENLFAALKNTSYFAQGVTLKSDIEVLLEKVSSMKAYASTPEEKIRSYRDVKAELDAAKVKIEQLKEFVTAAGSKGAFLGFVGGAQTAQTLAVWGLIIIMVAGFTFLALYIRTIQNQVILLQNGQMMAVSQETSGDGKKKKGKKEEETILSPDESAPKKGLKRHVRIGIAMLALLGIAGTAIAAVSFYKSQTPKETKVAAKVKTPDSKAQVLGDEETATTGAKIKIFVPEGASLSLHKEPFLDSSVLITLEKSRDALKIDKKDNWVKVRLSQGEGTITAWVDGDFVEEYSEETESKEKSGKKTVIIDQDLNGFLRVREAPKTGEIIDKVKAGDEFPLVSEKDGWIEIELPDGVHGFISAEYATIK